MSGDSADSTGDDSASAVADGPCTEVLIIGAGPAGMISALCLARSGVNCILLERRAELFDHPKAHELSARSIEILRQLGFTNDELRAEASDMETAARILFCNTINEEYGRIDLKAGGTHAKYAEHLAAPEPYLNISQTELERIMRAHVARQDRIRLLLEHQWESFEQHDDGVRSIVRDRSSDKLLRFQSRYVICADGAGSRSAAALGIAMQGPNKIQDFANAYFTNDLSDFVRTKAKLYWIQNPRAYGVMIAHHPAKRWVFHVPVNTPHEKIEDFTEDVFVERIRAALGAPELDVQIQSISHWRMTSQIAERFRDGRIFLVGDAAHRFPPTGGLGMNSGIGDAHNLCWKLAAVLQGQAGDDLLDSYATERMPVIEKNCRASLRNYHDVMDVPRACGLNPAGPPLLARALAAVPLRWLSVSRRQRFKSFLLAKAEARMQRLMRAADRREQVRSTVARQIGHFDRIGLDLGYTYAAGAVLDDGSPAPADDLPVGEYLPSTRPGARLPHFWLERDDQLKRPERVASHDLLAYDQWTLFVCAPRDDVEKQALESVLAGQLHVVFSDHPRLELEAGGFLLVRPDGQVACRKQRFATGDVPGEWIARALASLLSRPALESPGRLPAEQSGQSSRS